MDSIGTGFTSNDMDAQCEQRAHAERKASFAAKQQAAALQQGIKDTLGSGVSGGAVGFAEQAQQIGGVAYSRDPLQQGINLAVAQARATVNEAKQAAEPTIRTTVEVRATRRFTDAFDAALTGCRITRAGWNGAGQYVAMQYPDGRSKMSQPYLYLRNAQGDLVPWAPSQGDLFAHDWAILPR